MQVVILAAGLGTRMRPLTDSVPKPLVRIGEKPILERIITSLPSEIDELIIVVGYRGQQIKEYFGQSFADRSITYVEQPEPRGTGHALCLCQDQIHDRFLFMFADDLHGEDDLKKVVQCPRGMLVKATNTPEKFGIVECHSDGTLANLVEKPSREVAPSNLASTGVFVLDTHIFDYQPEVEVNGELRHADMVLRYAEKYPVQVEEQELWLPVAKPDDVKRVEAMLLG